MHHTELLLCSCVLLCTYCHLLHSSLTSCAELCFLGVVSGTPNHVTCFCQSKLEVEEDLQCVTASSSLFLPPLSSSLPSTGTTCPNSWSWPLRIARIASTAALGTRFHPPHVGKPPRTRPEDSCRLSNTGTLAVMSEFIWRL